MKVLGLQNKGVSKRLEEYSEEEILQAFQKESENLSQYKTIQHSSSINIIVWDVHHWNFWSSFSHFLEVAKVKCKSFRMCTRPTRCLPRWSHHTSRGIEMFFPSISSLPSRWSVQRSSSRRRPRRRRCQRAQWRRPPSSRGKRWAPSWTSCKQETFAI